MRMCFAASRSAMVRALVSAILTGYAGFTTSAVCIGPNIRVDHDVSLLVPEIWADVYLALLRELERKHFDVFSGHPYLSRRKKLAIACLRWAAQRASFLARRNVV